jgi:hypothetical protein
MRARGRLAAAILALALAGAAGCGSAANDYRGSVKDAQGKYLDQLQPVVDQLQQDIGANRYAAASRDAKRSAVIAGRLADAVDQLKPPDKLKSRATELVGAYRGFQRALTQLSTALKSRKQAAIQNALRTFNTAQQQESDAVDALNAAS